MSQHLALQDSGQLNAELKALLLELDAEDEAELADDSADEPVLPAPAASQPSSSQRRVPSPAETDALLEAAHERQHRSPDPTGSPAVIRRQPASSQQSLSSSPALDDWWDEAAPEPQQQQQQTSQQAGEQKRAPIQLRPSGTASTTAAPAAAVQAKLQAPVAASTEQPQMMTSPHQQPQHSSAATQRSSAPLDDWWDAEPADSSTAVSQPSTAPTPQPAAGKSQHRDSASAGVPGTSSTSPAQAQQGADLHAEPSLPAVTGPEAAEAATQAGEPAACCQTQ